MTLFRPRSLVIGAVGLLVICLGLAVWAVLIEPGRLVLKEVGEARETKHRHTTRALHVYHDEDGMVVLRGRLEPEMGALVMQALAAARESLYQRARERARASSGFGNVSAETPTVAQQRADALALLAEPALHHGLDPGTPGERYQVVVHVDAQVLADPEQPAQSVLEGGTRVSAETSQRLACDASRVVMRPTTNLATAERLSRRVQDSPD